MYSRMSFLRIRVVDFSVRLWGLDALHTYLCLVFWVVDDGLNKHLTKAEQV